MAQVSVKQLKDRLATAAKRLSIKQGAAGIAMFVYDLSLDGTASLNTTLLPQKVSVAGAHVLRMFIIPKGKFLAPDAAEPEPVIDDAQFSIFGVLDALDAEQLPEIASPVLGSGTQMTLFPDAPAVTLPASVLRVPRLCDAPILTVAPIPKLKLKSNTGETMMPVVPREKSFLDDPVKRDSHFAALALEMPPEKINAHRDERNAAKSVHPTTKADLIEFYRGQRAQGDAALAKLPPPIVVMAHGRAVVPENVPAAVTPKATVVAALPSPYAPVTPSDFTPMRL